jgi:hypothetical protein
LELERGLIVEQVLPPSARDNVWEDDHRGRNAYGKGLSVCRMALKRCSEAL